MGCGRYCTRVSIPCCPPSFHSSLPSFLWLSVESFLALTPRQKKCIATYSPRQTVAATKVTQPQIGKSDHSTTIQIWPAYPEEYKNDKSQRKSQTHSQAQTTSSASGLAGHLLRFQLGQNHSHRRDHPCSSCQRVGCHCVVVYGTDELFQLRY